MSTSRWALYMLLGSIAGLALGDSTYPSSNAARKFFPRQGRNGLLRSIPAVTKHGMESSLHRVNEVVTTLRKTRRRMHDADDERRAIPVAFYGMTPHTLAGKPPNRKADEPKPRKPSLKGTLIETLEELKNVRQEMETLRLEMEAMKQRMGGGTEDSSTELGRSNPTVSRQRRKEFERMSNDIMQWADRQLQRNGEDDGWTEVQCNSMFRNVFNRGGVTTAYLKWMKDSRGEYADKEDDREHPCIKMYATIDAPMENVCLYLSDEQRMTEYNDLVLKYSELEQVASHSKICWGRTPKILFIKPREFVTFCHLRWLRDGTQVVLNQACDHKDAKGTAFALRGATYISRDPDDPEKTLISMVAHGSPGNDVPAWASKAAVNAVAPIEPFKLFHKIREGVRQRRQEIEQRLEETTLVAQQGRSSRPGGLAQLGYASFWPDGGGLQDNSSNLIGGLSEDSAGTSAAEGQRSEYSNLDEEISESTEAHPELAGDSTTDGDITQAHDDASISDELEGTAVDGGEKRSARHLTPE